MSYSFDPASGATRDDLVELVIANSFSATRYTELARTWLNDAVTDVCRKLGMHQDFAILDYAADGTVGQPTNPFFHIQELWLARGNASGVGEQAFTRGAQWRLEPLRKGDLWPSLSPSSGQPCFYTVKRQAFTGRQPQPAIVVIPATTAGKVAIAGLTRPAVMDEAADVSGLGADLDDALVAFTKARCFRAEDDAEMTAFWRAEYENTLRDVGHVGEESDGPIVADGAWDC